MLEIFLNIGLFHYLFVAFCLFLIGFWGVIILKNTIKILICIELMMSAVCLNMVAFSAYNCPVEISGMTFSLFIMAISATQLAVGLSILIMLFKYKKNVDIEKFEDLKG